MRTGGPIPLPPSPRNLSPVTWPSFAPAREVKAAIRRELIGRWGARPITEINRRDVVHALEEIPNSGRPYAAHKLFDSVGELFGWAVTGAFIDWSHAMHGR